MLLKFVHTLSNVCAVGQRTAGLCSASPDNTVLSACRSSPSFQVTWWLTGDPVILKSFCCFVCYDLYFFKIQRTNSPFHRGILLSVFYRVKLLLLWINLQIALFSQQMFTSFWMLYTDTISDVIITLLIISLISCVMQNFLAFFSVNDVFISFLLTFY